MAHSHGHTHSHGHGQSGLGTAFLLNLAFTLLEIAGGLWTNSIAILADAVHDSGDCLSLGIAWYLQRVSRQEGDARFTYGYQRFDVLGALITGVVLMLGIGFILWKAIPRVFSPEEVYSPGMMALAVVGIAVNGAAFFRLKGGTSINERVAGWHLLEDTLGWVAVLVGGAIMYFGGPAIIDPLLSIGISLFVLWNVLKNLSQVLRVFLQRAPTSFDVEKFQGQVRGMPNVRSLHHTHVWTLNGEHHVLTTHVVMRPGSSRKDVLDLKHQIRKLLDGQPFTHVTVDVEMEDEPCLAELHTDEHVAGEAGHKE